MYVGIVVYVVVYVVVIVVFLSMVLLLYYVGISCRYSYIRYC